MAKRIAVIGTGAASAGNAAAPKEITAVAGALFAPALIETKLSVFPGTPFQRGLAAVGYIEAGIRAQDEGFDAVFINTFGDYGIDELKSALRIPVVGAGEAAMATAMTLGRKFAIVTIWAPSLNFIYDERLTACSMAARSIGVFNVLAVTEMPGAGGSEDRVQDMRTAKAYMIDRIVAAAETAIAQGADTIVLGCTCMAPIAALVASRISVPVIDPMTTGYLACETLLTLRLRQSKAAFPQPPPSALQAARDLVASVPVSADGDCDVCAIASAAE
jgi:allantoin racemase